MAYHTGEKLITIAGMAFIGGISLGALIGRENRIWVSENAGEFAQWLEERSRDTRKKTGKNLENIRKQVGKNLPKTFQDAADTARQSFQR